MRLIKDNVERIAESEMEIQKLKSEGFVEMDPKKESDSNDRTRKTQKLTGEKDEELLQILVEDATVWVLAYTNRTRLVSGLDKTVRDLAVIALNRIGTEGNQPGQDPEKAILSMMLHGRFTMF
ncbi:MAG: phage head-tail connector protein [Blautia sp.]